MAQPTLDDFFRFNSIIDTSGDSPTLTIDLGNYRSLGLDNTSSALSIFAAIVFGAHNWLVANTDESVQANSTLSISSPTLRNEIERTSFVFALEFFNNYDIPTFEPDLE